MENLLKIKVLIIEIRLHNIDKMKKSLNDKNIIFASSFLDVADTIDQENIQVIGVSDFRGENSTVGYIKMFKRANPNFKVIIISEKKEVNNSYASFFIQRGAETVISSYDIAGLHNEIIKLNDKYYNEQSHGEKLSHCSRKALKYLKLHYQESPRMLKILSRAIGYSTSSISHSVLRDTGLRVTDWVRKLRIEGAMELLKNTNLNIKEIGRLVGYQTTQGFIKAFIKLMNKTPSEYRKDLP